MPKIVVERRGAHAAIARGDASNETNQETASSVNTGQHGITFNKSFGQHILTNPLVIKSIVDKSGLKPSETVLEIGPGTGNLSAEILKTAKRLVVCEVDPRMVAELQKRFQGTAAYQKLQIIHGDFLTQEVPPFTACISNVPYQISSPLVFRLLSMPFPWRVAVLMFQKEFSDRLCAKPGSEMYCRLSANVQLLADVTHLIKVGKKNFRPPPKVESSVVRIEPKHPRPNINFVEWDGLLRICFNRKGKTLRAQFTKKSVTSLLMENYKVAVSISNDLDANLEFSMREKVERVLDTVGYGNARARAMDQDDFLRLLAAFNAEGIHFK